MSIGLIDTNILIGVYRNNPAAMAWFAAQEALAVCSVAWLEFMEGARGKAGQRRCLEILAPLDLVFVAEGDQRWAMGQVLRYRLSHGVSFKDCLIASVAYRLQVPLYTQNVKDFEPLLGVALVSQPY